MSATIFCCAAISPYRPRPLDHEAKFTAFTHWAALQKSAPPLDGGSPSVLNTAPYAVQLVRQINYGPQESIRYFVPGSDGASFVEATEDDLVDSNFEKLNSYKNFRCHTHNRFFEVNLYQKSPANAHHWRSTLARPSRDIDLALRRRTAEKLTVESTAEREEKQEPPRFSTTDAALQDVQSSLLPAREATQGKSPKEPEPLSRPDTATLKRTLGFLLAKFRLDLDSSSLVSLLCLDQTSAELDLGLEFESLWQTKLTSSNLRHFFLDCFTAFDAHGDVEVNLGEVEDLVIPAMRQVDSRNTQLPTGRARMHEIVKATLESGRGLDWVSVYRESILDVFTSGPSEALLEHCRRMDGTIQENRSSESVGAACGAEGEEDNEEAARWSRWSPQDDYDGRDDWYSDDGAAKYYTACDKECGYCGTCEY